jgi:N-acetylglucosaminyl-diphospho-decaprenol L-rhamnosyltransferase
MGFSGVTNGSGAAVTVSIVSHGQGEMVATLLKDLVRCPEVSHVILTHNLPEPEIPVPQKLATQIEVIRNSLQKGFAANHNAAFERCRTPFYCVLNPDVRMPGNPFPRLLDVFDNPRVAFAAPAVVNSGGGIEDSARRFPTPWILFRKAVGADTSRWTYRLGDSPQSPDWVAGMFLLARSDVFRELGGFDAGYFLYYEDVDLCARARSRGYELLLCPAIHVIHDARRTSHRSVRYLRWHLGSMFRFFLKHLGRLPRRVSIGQ